MPEQQFKCGEVLPHWNHYQTNPRDNLEWFVRQLKGEITRVEEVLESSFRNPSVTENEIQCKKYLDAISIVWDLNTANLAALASVRCYMAVCKTAAGHYIVSLRNFIESTAQKQEAGKIQLHRKARDHYELAVAMEFEMFEEQMLDKKLQVAEDCIAAFCRALGAARFGEYVS